jgi:hypothetical protein
MYLGLQLPFTLNTDLKYLTDMKSAFQTYPMRSIATIYTGPTIWLQVPLLNDDDDDDHKPFEFI